jgi:hypothetical protein
MQKIILTISVLCFGTSVFAQSPTPSKKTKFNNVISMNPSAGIISSFYPTQYQQNEYLGMYHRIFGNANAVRIGINGTVNNTDSKMNDTITTNSKSKTYKIGIGYEHYQYLTKAWNFYYGADMQYELTNSTSFSNQNISYGNNRLNKANSIGALAFFGILVHFNARISATIENGVALSQEKSEYEYEYLKSGIKTIQKSSNNITNVRYVNPQLHLRFRF